MNTSLSDFGDVGGLGVMHLKRLWSRSMRERNGLAVGDSCGDEWPLDNVIYHGLHLSIEETIQHLYQNAPSFDEFEAWVLERNGGALDEALVCEINRKIETLISSAGREPSGHLPAVDSDLDLDFWNENGYVVVSGVFSEAEIAAAEQAVWEDLEMDPLDAESWYRRRGDHGIMVQLFHHPALDAIRHSPKLRDAFASIWGTTDLLVSTDRVSFNPPERPGFEFPGPRLHWDVSLELPIPFGVQGLVYLTDTQPEQGAFTCVPGFHTRIDSWIKGLPADSDPRGEEMDKLVTKPIAGKAGDVVIWHQALPHGSSPNRMTRPRIVQYVTMFPADAEYAKNWK